MLNRSDVSPIIVIVSSNPWVIHVHWPWLDADGPREDKSCPSVYLKRAANSWHIEASAVVALSYAFHCTVTSLCFYVCLLPCFSFRSPSPAHHDHCHNNNGRNGSAAHYQRVCGWHASDSWVELYESWGVMSAFLRITNESTSMGLCSRRLWVALIPSLRQTDGVMEQSL